jgi:hypothetical protein
VTWIKAAVRKRNRRSDDFSEIVRYATTLLEPRPAIGFTYPGARYELGQKFLRYCRRPPPIVALRASPWYWLTMERTWHFLTFENRWVFSETV